MQLIFKMLNLLETSSDPYNFSQPRLNNLQLYSLAVDSFNPIQINPQMFDFVRLVKYYFIHHHMLKLFTHELEIYIIG